MLVDGVLNDYRNEIDALDCQLVDVLGRRMDVCIKVGERKKELGIEVIQDPDREESLMKRLEGLETHNGLVRKLWPVIIEFSRSLQ